MEDESYQLIEIFGKPALFSNHRITSQDIPKGLYCYDLRHGDDGQFCSIEPKVTVNHGGSVITNVPISFGESGYISFAEDADPNFLGMDITIGEYMRGEFGQDEIPNQQMGGI